MYQSDGFSFAAAESLMGNIKARCLSDAELFCNALVITAPKRQRSTQCCRAHCTHSGEDLFQSLPFLTCLYVAHDWIVPSFLCRAKYSHVPHLVVIQKHHGSLAQTVSRVQISTMCVKDNLMVAGGFQGELICKV